MNLNRASTDPEQGTYLFALQAIDEMMQDLQLARTKVSNPLYGFCMPIEDKRKQARWVGVLRTNAVHRGS